MKAAGAGSGRPVAKGIRPLLAATGVSVAGDGALNTAAPLLAVTLTTDPFAVAAVTAAIYLPWLFLGLPAGALVDRWPRRLVLVCANLVQAGVLALFCVLLLVGQATLAALVVAVVLVNAAHCFFSPASQGVMPAVLGRDEDALIRANGRYIAIDAVGRTFVGPLGGAWVFTVNRVLPFLADAVSFLVSAALLSRLPSMPPSPGPHERVIAAVRTGIRQLYQIRELFVLVLALAAYNVGYFAAIATLALYTRDVLHVNEIAFGVLFAVLSAAGIATGWWGTGLLRGRSPARVQAMALSVQGIGWLVVAIAGSFWVTVVLFACTGVTAALGTISNSAAYQRLSPEDSIGRVVSLFRLFGLGASGIGAMLGGWIASGYGLSAPLVFAAVIQLVAAGAVWQWCRSPRANSWG